MTSVEPVRLAYDEHPPEGGADEDLAPIVYLHGLGAFKETWEELPQNVANATKRMSYSLDARNHGGSERSDLFNLDMNVDDLIHWMDSLDIRKAVIVGHSMGGITAMKTALREPERVEKIVVEDISCRKLQGPTLDSIVGLFGIMRKALEEVPEGLEDIREVQKFVMKRLCDGIPPEMKMDLDEDRHSRFVGLERGADGRFVPKCNVDAIEKALQNKDTLDSDMEGQFEGDACFIYGKTSPFSVGADEDNIKKFFPNAILEGIDETGHDVHIDKPQEFTDILLKFLS